MEKHTISLFWDNIKVFKITFTLFQTLNLILHFFD